MLKSNFEFEVLVHGNSTKEYYHKGNHYIEGKRESRFSLRMRNNSSKRVLFVPTVDGLSIMSGKEGSFKSKGYIVDAHDALTIDGWRTSDDKVAEFFFSSPKDSYAKQIKKGGNLGVIGCAVFNEKEKEITSYYTYPGCCKNSTLTHCPNCDPFNLNNGTMIMAASSLESHSDNSFLCNVSASGNPNVNASYTTSSSKSLNGLGTGFGQDKYSPVVSVEFDRESHPTEIFSIFYNTRENLEALGVEFRKVVYTSPSAFPNEDGYCKRPY